MTEREVPERYQDCVIKDGKFVGRFDEMYQRFDDPWHQSESRVTQDSHSRWATVLTARRLGVQSILEVGCGLGHYTHTLASHVGARVTGVDISPTAVAKARTSYPQQSFVVGDAATVLKESDTAAYDAVLFAEVTWYLVEQFDALMQLLADRWKGKVFLHNLVFYKGQQQYGRELFTTLDEFIRRVPFDLIARYEGTMSTDDAIETATAFRIS